MNIANLDSGTRACVAVQAEAVMATLREEAAKNTGGRPRADAKPRQLIAEVSADSRKSSARAALLFGTNREHKSARPG